MVNKLLLLQCLPLDQVIHGLFRQEDQGDQQGLHHPGDNKVTVMNSGNKFFDVLHLIRHYLAVLLAACYLSTSVKRSVCDSLMMSF